MSACSQQYTQFFGTKRFPALSIARLRRPDPSRRQAAKTRSEGWKWFWILPVPSCVVPARVDEPEEGIETVASPDLDDPEPVSLQQLAHRLACEDIDVSRHLEPARIDPLKVVLRVGARHHDTHRSWKDQLGQVIFQGRLPQPSITLYGSRLL
jgi:hypothetical protein